MDFFQTLLTADDADVTPENAPVQNRKRKHDQVDASVVSESESDDAQMPLDESSEESDVSVSEEKLRGAHTTRSGRVSKQIAPEERLQQDRPTEGQEDDDDEEAEDESGSSEPPRKRAKTASRKKKGAKTLKEINLSAGVSQTDGSFVVYARPLAVTANGLVAAVSFLVSEYTDEQLGCEKAGTHVCRTRTTSTPPTYDSSAKPLRTFRASLLAEIKAEGTALSDYASPFCIHAFRVKHAPDGKWMNELDSGVAHFSVKPTFEMAGRMRSMRGMPMATTELRRWLVNKPAGKSRQVFSCACAAGVPTPDNALFSFEFVCAERVDHECRNMGVKKIDTLRPLIALTIPTNGRSVAPKGRSGEMVKPAAEVRIASSAYKTVLLENSAFMEIAPPIDAELIEVLRKRYSDPPPCMDKMLEVSESGRLRRRFFLCSQSAQSTRRAWATLGRAPAKALGLLDAAKKSLQWHDGAGIATHSPRHATRLDPATEEEAKALLSPMISGGFWALVAYFGFADALRIVSLKDLRKHARSIERNPLNAFFVPHVVPRYPQAIARDYALLQTGKKCEVTSVAAHDALPAGWESAGDFLVAKKLGAAVRGPRWTELSEEELEHARKVVECASCPITIEEGERATNVQWRADSSRKEQFWRMANQIYAEGNLPQLIYRTLQKALELHREDPTLRFLVVGAGSDDVRLINEMLAVVPGSSELSMLILTTAKVLKLGAKKLSALASAGTVVIVPRAERLPVLKLLAALRYPELFSDRELTVASLESIAVPDEAPTSTPFHRVLVGGLAHANRDSAFELLRQPRIQESNDKLLGALIEPNGGAEAVKTIVDKLSIEFTCDAGAAERRVLMPSGDRTKVILLPTRGKVTVDLSALERLRQVTVRRVNSATAFVTSSGVTVDEIVVLLEHESNPLWSDDGTIVRKGDALATNRRLIARLVREQASHVYVIGSPVGLFAEGVLGEQFWYNEEHMKSDEYDQ